MRFYSQLSDDERDQIAILRAAGRSMGVIARALGRAKTTISRELQRNALPSGGYSPLHAAGAYQLRRRRDAILEREAALRLFVRDRLAEGWTPEQISGWLKSGNEPRLRAICCETIYAFIYRTGQKAEALWRYRHRLWLRRVDARRFSEGIGGQCREQRRGLGGRAELSRPVPAQRHHRRQPDGVEEDQLLAAGGVCRERWLGDHAEEQGSRIRRIASARRHSQCSEIGYELHMLAPLARAEYEHVNLRKFLNRRPQRWRAFRPCPEVNADHVGLVSSEAFRSGTLR
jgi:hypothetical protein